jgi:hypothetical protein
MIPVVCHSYASATTSLRIQRRDSQDPYTPSALVEEAFSVVQMNGSLSRPFRYQATITVHADSVSRHLRLYMFDNLPLY